MRAKETIAPERRIETARERALLTSRARLRGELRRQAEQPPHPVRLGGLHTGGNFAGMPDRAPLLVERKDQNFVAGLMADLQAGDEVARQRVFGSPPGRDNNVLRLFHPVQRVATLAVLEAFCDVPGTPRLDRGRIQSAGLVLRRLGPGGRKEAWVKGGTRIFGWDVIDEDADPEADKRLPPQSTGHPVLDRLLPSQQIAMRARAQRLASVFGPDTEVTESVSPLFVAPPEACLATGRTVLFGVVPVVSNEQAEAPAESPRYGEDPRERAQLRNHLVHYLKAGSRKSLQGEGRVLDPSWAKRAVDPASPVSKPAPANIETFLLLLQQLHVELDAFGGSAESRALFARLNELTIERTAADGTLRSERAGNFLRKAKEILLDAQPNTGNLTMPGYWGSVSAAQAEAILEATLRCLDARYLELRVAQGRFDDPNAQYVVRAFVRLKPEHPQCPGKLVWSPYSEPFRIAPWYESAGAAPPLIQLPDLFDRNTLKKLKPNVAFAMPPKLAALLDKNARRLRDGDANESGWSIGWICSFSLPIITLCAFIVLNIFLKLFAMIFFWLPFLKVCIPLPRKQ